MAKEGQLKSFLSLKVEYSFIPLNSADLLSIKMTLEAYLFYLIFFYLFPYFMYAKSESSAGTAWILDAHTFMCWRRM